MLRLATLLLLLTLAGCGPLLGIVATAAGDWARSGNPQVETTP